MHTRAVDLRRINTKLLECYIVCKQLLRRLFLPRDAIRKRGISVRVCKDHKAVYKMYCICTNSGWGRGWCPPY